MKNIITFFCTLCFIVITQTSVAQKANADYSAITDRAEAQLSNTDTIPDFRSKINQLKLTGIVYQSDGVTPAKDVILFIEQPDENGNFDLRHADDNRYVFHRSWVKTDADGRYTFYTFVPGGDRRFNQLQQIFPLIKAPTQPAYALETFLFDEDPLLTRTCRKRMAKKGDPTRVLKPTLKDGILVAERHITLKTDLDLAEL
ncbi:MAG: hypothetical protein AB8B52_10810 [Winogradskyella sp.]|uniref:hypothetical protein n=1 Tax=Winogradskyella sp. TaxID=1883156 RepID=UPI00385FDA27